jgi:hypothetical protein
MIIEPLIEYSNNSNGILITWDYSGTDYVTRFSITRAHSGFQNDLTAYEEIDIVDYPTTYYIDETGVFSDYYIIKELDDDEENPTELYVHPYIYGEEALLNTDIYWELSQFLNMRCYRDRLFFSSSNRQKARASMGCWNKIPEPKLEITSKNSDETQGYQTIYRTTDDEAFSTTELEGGDYPNGLRYDVDYNGNISFFDYDESPVSIKPYDEVWATYNFRAITTKNINAALKQALHGILVQPGVNKGYTTVAQVPVRWDRAIIAGASCFLLRQLALQLTVPEPAIFFAMDLRDPESTFSQVNDRYEKINAKSKEYMEEYWKWCEVIRIERYPQILAIVTPEFQLPGGKTRLWRSMWKGNNIA